MAITYTHRVLAAWPHGPSPEGKSLRTEHKSLKGAEASARTLAKRGYTNISIISIK